MVHFQHRTVRQGVAAAQLRDERFSDNLVFQIIKQFFVDAALDFLTGKAAPGFEAEDVVRSAAGEGFFPDAHGGPHADIALPHGKFLSEGQPLRPALHHPFAFDFHNASLFHADFWHFLFIIT